MRHAYLSIGSNIDPVANATSAVRELAATRELAAVSTFYRTPAVHGDQPPFVNGVVAVKPRDKDVPTLLTRLRRLEDALGRKRGPDKYAPRTIDVDLIAWPSQADDRLPHPNIERYDFVARPLSELNPHVLTSAGRPVVEAARSLLPHGMSPLDALTRELRKLLYHTRRSVHA